jgi:hypothetical protein
MKCTIEQKSTEQIDKEARYSSNENPAVKKLSKAVLKFHKSEFWQQKNSMMLMALVKALK